MPRARKIWHKAGRTHFYTKIDGVQTRLGPVAKGEAHSQRLLEKILKGDVQPTTTGGLTFARLADRFLDHSLATNEKETYEVHKYFLQSFKDHVGNRLVARLCEDDLDAWCRQHATQAGTVDSGGRRQEDRQPRRRTGRVWSPSTQARGKAVVLAVLNFGVKKLNLPPHPLKHVKPGSVGSRQRYLTAGERAAIRAAVQGEFAEYCLALEQTGARPLSEVGRVTAADVDLEKGTWTLAKWKNSRKQPGKKRVIYLSEPLLQLTRKLLLKHPEGPLFRSRTGKPWTRQAVTARFRSLAAELGIQGLTAYVFRHTAISDALLRGVPVAVCAELYGTSIQTISRVYAHVDQREDVLKEAMRKALGA